mgnify:FL=1
MNDSELVQGLRDQDPAAVRHLTECHLPSVWRFVYVRANCDRHLSEDVVSEAVLALVRAAACETVIENPMAWLKSVASNKLRDHFRAAARVQHHVDKVARSASDDNDAPRQQELTERRREVLQAMDGLPDQQRLALEWKYVDRLSVREIAGRLETSEKAAESILFRARRAFRERLVGTIERSDDRTNGRSGDHATPQTQLTTVKDNQHVPAARKH